MTLEVVEAAGVATVQDVAVRAAWRRFGVPSGGAADAFSAVLANRLLGNADEAAVVEVTGALVLGWPSGGAVAVTGGLAASIDGLPMRPDAVRGVPAGGRLRLAPGDGMRGYVAVPGGIAADPVLGSRATDLRTGFGGHDGRALRAGDRLETGPTTGRANLGRWTGARPIGPIRIAPGPHATEPAIAGVVAAGWRVGSAGDRTGIRLDGPRIEVSGDEVASIGLLPGAIQVPRDGVPIVMLADGPVTGGYPVVACVIAADIGRVAQLRPGDGARFALVTTEEARDAWHRVRDELAAIEPLGAADDDELAWIGSHE